MKETLSVKSFMLIVSPIVAESELIGRRRCIIRNLCLTTEMPTVNSRIVIVSRGAMALEKI
jgi:hypothetical protein